MKTVLMLLALAATAASLAIDDYNSLEGTQHQGKWNYNDQDTSEKQKIILKLLNHILQPTAYADIRECSRTYKIEDNYDKYIKMDVVKDFLYNWKVGMLPKGEIFTISNVRQLQECVKVFHILFYAKDFDTFIKSACWMREHINEGMFVYALNVAVLHREDCRGVILPTPCEIYPFYFINSDVIHKAYMIKMKQGKLDEKLAHYYNIRVTDKNVVLIDDQRNQRSNQGREDKLSYFTEDIGLNTYFYYFHAEYPLWMGDDVYGKNKDRRGELYYYIHQQLQARYNLERLSNDRCDVKMWDYSNSERNSYWPRLALHNGHDMPARNGINSDSEGDVHLKRLVEDYNRRIRDAITDGHVTLHDGTRYSIRKPEDIEYLGRLIQGNLDKDDVKFCRYLIIFVRALMRPNSAQTDQYTTPTVLDQWETSLRDPLFWQLQARLVDNFVAFKNYLPSYTRVELDFPGVKIENVATDKLVTYFDSTDIDITNSVILTEQELSKQKSDQVYVARKEQLNHLPFKINIDVASDKAVDCVVRVFLGPKYDCNERKVSLNEKRNDYVEIDSFKYNLQTGKNTIVRDSHEMSNLIEDRAWARSILEKRDSNGPQPDHESTNTQHTGDYWRRTIVGFPQRLLLPKGKKGGLELQLLVHIAPVHNDKKLQELYDVDELHSKSLCRYTTCIDSRPLGYPLDRGIDQTHFYTNNLRTVDVLVFHKRGGDTQHVRSYSEDPHAEDTNPKYQYSSKAHGTDYDFWTDERNYY